MLNIKDELLGVVRALNDAGVPYALCGGMAVVLHGYPRLTRDIDILIEPDRLGHAGKALASVGFDISGGMLPFDIGKRHERKIFRVSKVSGEDILTVDLLLLPDYLRSVWDAREQYEVADVPVWVVSRAGLIQMKRISGRPRDMDDIENLEGI